MADALVTVDDREIRKLARNLAKAAAESAAFAKARFLYEAQIIAKDAEDQYKAVTPVLTGALQASTTTNVVAEAGSLLGVVIQVRQPATNQSGQPYVRWVVEPHEQWAWGHDTGNQYPGNPYPTKANAVLFPAIARMQARTATATQVDLIHCIKEGDHLP